MNAQRLVALANILEGELRSSNAVKVLKELTTTVQAAINSPNESTQRAVETVVSSLRSSLESAQTNQLSPGLRGDLAELKVGDVPATQLVGRGLLEELNVVFENGYTSVQTLDQVRVIQEQVAALSTALQSLTQGVAGLSLPSEDLPVGESVVGMTVPRVEVRDGMRELIKELLFFDKLITDLSECVDGQARDPQVMSLRSSDFGIDVSTTLDVAGIFALIVKGVQLALAKINKYRKLKADAEELGVAETVEAIDRKSTEALETAVEEIEAEVFQHCKLDDTGRINELKTSIKFKINGLANRLERGFSFEVRTALPAKPDDKATQMGQMVTALSQISFEPITGPRLLALPEGEDEQVDGGGAADKKPKKAKAQKAH